MKLSFLELRRCPELLIKALGKHKVVELYKRNVLCGLFVAPEYLSLRKRPKLANHPAVGMRSKNKRMQKPVEFVNSVRAAWNN